jgi:hypothetical protein
MSGIPHLIDAAASEYRRREQVWTRRIAAEWSPEKRGSLESRAQSDLAIWDAIIDFLEDPLARPDDLEACWQSARKLVDHLRTAVPVDAAPDDQSPLVGLWHLERHLAAAAATRRACREFSQQIHNHDEGRNAA